MQPVVLAETCGNALPSSFESFFISFSMIYYLLFFKIFLTIPFLLFFFFAEEIPFFILNLLSLSLNLRKE